MATVAIALVARAASRLGKQQPADESDDGWSYSESYELLLNKLFDSRQTTNCSNGRCKARSSFDFINILFWEWFDEMIKTDIYISQGIAGHSLGAIFF